MPTPATTDLYCPRCKGVLPVTEGKLPENCPGCNFLLRARRQKAFNHNFLLAFRKAFVWRGRSTRREFWGYATIMGGLGVLIALVLDLLFVGEIARLISRHIVPLPVAPEPVQYIAGATLGAALLLWLAAAPLPLLSLSIRRLHDIGRSMLWLVLPLLCWGAAIGLLICTGAGMVIIPLIFNPQSPAIDLVNMLSHYSLAGASALGLLATILSLVLLMFFLMDSDRGTNKYGPSAKYPLE